MVTITREGKREGGRGTDDLPEEGDALERLTKTHLISEYERIKLKLDLHTTVTVNDRIDMQESMIYNYVLATKHIRLLNVLVSA